MQELKIFFIDIFYRGIVANTRSGTEDVSYFGKNVLRYDISTAVLFDSLLLYRTSIFTKKYPRGLLRCRGRPLLPRLTSIAHPTALRWETCAMWIVRTGGSATTLLDCAFVMLVFILTTAVKPPRYLGVLNGVRGKSIFSRYLSLY